MKSISKEIFIFALLLMIVVFMIGMAFYKFMPNNKMVPEPIEYTADSAISTILKEIAASTKYNYSNDEKEVENVIKSYSIGPKELNSAASKKAYVSGKTNPFAEYKDSEANTSNPSTEGNIENNKQNNANSNSKSSSSGTFFEDKNSK